MLELLVASLEGHLRVSVLLGSSGSRLGSLMLVGLGSSASLGSLVLLLLGVVGSGGCSVLVLGSGEGFLVGGELLFGHVGGVLRKEGLQLGLLFECLFLGSSSSGTLGSGLLLGEGFFL